jgi:outer membrane scaffolding protein for murein synthesis (MipA/OmpV family)
MLLVTYRGRFFLGPAPGGAGFGLGARLVQARGLGLGAEVGISDSRPASRDPALAGMDDRAVMATVSTSLIYRTGPVELGLRLARGINDGGGFLATTRVSLSRRLGRLAATVGAGISLADARQMRRDFGITQGEADRRQALMDAGDTRLRSGDATEYRPGAGLRQFGGSLSLRYAMSANWSFFGFGGVDRLSDRASRSALVRRRVQASLGLGIGFHP